MEQNPSICIPRVDITMSRNYIFNKLRLANFGKIIKIIEIPLKKDENYKRIIVKIRWNENDKRAIEFRDKLNNGESIILVHEMPWFWKIILAI